MVTRVLPSGTSLRSDRTRAPASSSAVTSGTSDRSMSFSFRARTRRKSVRETLEVFFLLIPGRLSHGDDANLLIGFRVRDDDDDVLEHSQGYEAVLAAFESVVLHRQSDPEKTSGASSKSKTCLSRLESRFLPSHTKRTSNDTYIYAYTRVIDFAPSPSDRNLRGHRLFRLETHPRDRAPGRPGRRPGDPVLTLDSLFPHPETILDESLLQAFPESVSADERSEPRTVGKNRANQRQEESERSISRTVEGKMRREISLE